MRDIRFKFWLKHLKKMTYPHTLQEACKFIDEMHDNIICLQYLDIKDDYNDIRLCEGDWVEMEYSSLGSRFNIKGVIRYNQKYAQFVVKRGLRIVPLSVSNRTIKYKGNVYENPELGKY